MKTYVVKSAADETVWKLETLSKPNDRVVGPAIWNEFDSAYEDPTWLQIENIDDGFGDLVPTLTVNQTLKDTIIAERAAAKTAAETLTKTKKIASRGLKKKLKQITREDIKDAESFRNILWDLVKAVEMIEAELWNIDEDEVIE